jgi:hypothetical protein
MRNIVRATTIAITLAVATLAVGNPVNAAVGVSFDIGNVAVGYSDGYYDNDRHWHRWAHRADATHYRAAHADQYHTWRHDDPKHPDNHP